MAVPSVLVRHKSVRITSSTGVLWLSQGVLSRSGRGALWESSSRRGRGSAWQRRSSAPGWLDAPIRRQRAPSISTGPHPPGRSRASPRRALAIHRSGRSSRTISPPVRAWRSDAPFPDRAAWRSGKVPAGLMICDGLISGHLGLDLVRPFVDPADEVLRLAEADFPQEIRDAARADAGLAVHADLVGRAELVHPRRTLGYRHQDRLVQAGDLPFHRLANVEEADRVAPVEPLLQLRDRDLELLPDLFRWTPQAAELLVVDEFLDRRIRSADRALGVLAQLELPELHPERVEDEETTDQGVAASEEKFDRLDRLDRSDNAREHPEHSALRTRRDEAGRRRFRVQTPVTRTLRRVEDARLAFEAEDRSVDVWLVQEDRRIVHEVSGREVVRSIDDDVVVFQNVQCVLRGEARLVRLDVDVRVDLSDALLRDVDLLAADVFRPVQHLALQVRLVDHVEVDDPETADAGGAEVLGERHAESPGADDDGGRLLEFQLPRHADLGQDQVPGIALDFRRHEHVLALRSQPIHQRKRTARDAGDDRDRVSLLQGGRILLEVADVLLVDVDVHEVPQSAVVRVQMTPKLVEAVHEVVEGLFDAFGLDVHRIVVRRVLTKGRRNDDPDRSHGRTCSMTVLYLRFVPRVLRIRIR